MLEAYQNAIITWRGLFGDTQPIRTAFNGHVMTHKATFDIAKSNALYKLRTTDGILEEGWLQGIGFADVGGDGRDHYHQFGSVVGGGERMTVGRLVRHILGYYDTLGTPPATNPDWVAHTNLVFHPSQNPYGWINLDNVTTEPFNAATNPGGSMRTDRYIVRETSNLWSTLQKMADSEFFFIYFTKNNKLHYERHPMFATTLPTAVMTLTDEHIVGEPQVQFRNTKQIEQVTLHAVTDDGDTLHSEYPASPTHVYGNTIEQSHIRCNDGDTLDEWAERKYTFANRPYTVTVELPGLMGLLFELMDRIAITYTGTTANGVHINWTEEKFWIHSIDVMPGEDFGGTTRLSLEAENS
jgi:hypothetical protein